MTMDITIGKQVPCADDCEIKDPSQYCCFRQCPDSDVNFGDRKEAYRSGNFNNLKTFFTSNSTLLDVYFRMREHPVTNDTDAVYIKDYIKEINSVKLEEYEDEYDKQRLEWLQKWCNRAIELYSDDAMIMFT